MEKRLCGLKYIPVDQVIGIGNLKAALGPVVW